MDFDTIKALAKPYATAAIRHAVTGIAGALVGLGAVQASDEAKLEDIATGAAVWAVGYALSAVQKYVQNRRVLSALNTAAPAVPATVVPAKLT